MASKCSTRCRAPSGRSTTTYSRVRRPEAVASLVLGMRRSAAVVRLLGAQRPRSRSLWLHAGTLEGRAVAARSVRCFSGRLQNAVYDVLADFSAHVLSRSGRE